MTIHWGLVDAAILMRLADEGDHNKWYYHKTGQGGTQFYCRKNMDLPEIVLPGITEVASGLVPMLGGVQSAQVSFINTEGPVASERVVWLYFYEAIFRIKDDPFGGNYVSFQIHLPPTSVDTLSIDMTVRNLTGVLRTWIENIRDKSFDD